MPRETKKEKFLERTDANAPFLFDMHGIPVRADLLELIKPEYKHTGDRAMENEQLAVRVVELLQAKWGLKKIAREVNVSKWTVKAFRDELVKQGKLAPFEERLNALREEIMEVGAEQYLEKLEDGFVAAAQIPLAHGIFSDKRAASRGQPTSVVGTVKVDPALDINVLNDYLAKLPSCNPPPDSESGGKDVKPQ